MADSTPGGRKVLSEAELEFLTLDQIKMIDEALHSVEKFGEVRLVVDNNRLRFVVCQNSYDAIAFKPGQIQQRGRS
jgi:hypothetical protein